MHVYIVLHYTLLCYVTLPVQCRDENRP